MSKQPIIPPGGHKVHLEDYDPDDTDGFADEAAVQSELEADLQRLSVLQEKLYAESKRAVLVVLQAMDTGGKDGLIKHVFRGLNPTGVQVTSFKVPTAEEAAHDFLWRIHQRTPRKGVMGVFNRSHYEDVLVVRVHELVPKKVWKSRYDAINHFERLLTEENTTILKFFLHISRGEQKQRLEARLQDKEKLWKFDPNDLKERQRWDDYMKAYESVLSKCNTEEAPWHIIPANHKWYRNYLVTRILVETMERMDLQYPPAAPGLEGLVVPD